MKYPVLFLIILLQGFLPVSGQDSTVQPDTSVVELRSPDPDRIKDYVSDSDFIYEEEPEESISLLQLIYMKIFEFLNEFFDGSIANNILHIFLILILVGVVILIVNQFMEGNIKNAFLGSSSSDRIQMSLEKSGIEETDIESLINRAIAAQNFREAVRLTYHKALQNLNRANVIRWGLNKTNYEYLQEIGDHPSTEPFKKLTTIYNYTEYGDFGIDKAGYEKVNRLYRRITDELRADG